MKRNYALTGLVLALFGGMSAYAAGQITNERPPKGRMEAGEASYLLMVQVATPADLESLLAKIRVAAGASTLTSLVLSIPFQDRPVL